MRNHKGAKQPNRIPLLGQGGVDAPSKKWTRSFEGAAGVVCSTTDNRWLEPTTPSAPAKEASRRFLDGRSHPSLSKEGSSIRLRLRCVVPFCGYSSFCPDAIHLPRHQELHPRSQGIHAA